MGEFGQWLSKAWRQQGDDEPRWSFRIDESWQWDAFWCESDGLDFGTMFTDGRYHIFHFPSVNAVAKSLFLVIGQSRNDGHRVIALPLGADGELEEHLPVLLVARREFVPSVPYFFAAVQSWADALSLIEADNPRRAAGLGPEPVAPYTPDPESLIGLIAFAASAMDPEASEEVLTDVARFLAERAGHDVTRARPGDYPAVAEALEGILWGWDVNILLKVACDGLQNCPIDVRRSALDIAVRVVTVSGYLTNEEGWLLRTIADRLGLNASLQHALDDAEWLHMHTDSDADMAVGLPLGLTTAEELTWLRKAWNTWSNRSTKLSDRERREKVERLLEHLDLMMQQREDD